MSISGHYPAPTGGALPGTITVSLQPTEGGWIGKIDWPTGGAYFTSAADYETVIDEVGDALSSAAASTIDYAEDLARRDRQRRGVWR